MVFSALAELTEQDEKTTELSIRNKVFLHMREKMIANKMFHSEVRIFSLIRTRLYASFPSETVYYHTDWVARLSVYFLIQVTVSSINAISVSRSLFRFAGYLYVFSRVWSRSSQEFFVRHVHDLMSEMLVAMPLKVKELRNRADEAARTIQMNQKVRVAWTRRLRGRDGDGTRKRQI